MPKFNKSTIRTMLRNLGNQNSFTRRATSFGVRDKNFNLVKLPINNVHFGEKSTPKSSVSKTAFEIMQNTNPTYEFMQPHVYDEINDLDCIDLSISSRPPTPHPFSSPAAFKYHPDMSLNSIRLLSDDSQRTPGPSSITIERVTPAAVDDDSDYCEIIDVMIGTHFGANDTDGDTIPFNPLDLDSGSSLMPVITKPAPPIVDDSSSLPSIKLTRGQALAVLEPKFIPPMFLSKAEAALRRYYFEDDLSDDDY